jgi:hypothetical protein
MLTLIELDKLLKYNESLTAKELARGPNASLKILGQLSVHRSTIKDCIIELLIIKFNNDNRKVA